MINKTFVPLRLGDVIAATDVYLDKTYKMYTVFKPASSIDVGHVITADNLHEQVIEPWYRPIDYKSSLLLNTLSNKPDYEEISHTI